MNKKDHSSSGTYTQKRHGSHKHSLPVSKYQPKSILKSEKEKKCLDDLLVFGYGSKLYPPDKYSKKISKNEHLILWNDDANANLLIDRYDCRASLHDLSEFDVDSWNKSHQISEEEIRLEERLDEERYRAMRIDELEENIRQDEEMKRLHASIGTAGAQIGHVYSESEPYDPFSATPEEAVDDVEVAAETVDEDENPFIAPSSLSVPSEMEIPPTEKMHAIIEKTALFISSQGPQMEIVLKAKQSGNSQFQFLQFGHYLNPYFKHMVKRIKEGKYTPGMKSEDKENEESETSSDEDGGYLHPSLFAASHKQDQKEKEEKTKAIRTIDPNHPLAKLIEKGRAANAAKQYQKMAETYNNYYSQQQQHQTPTNGDIAPPPLPPYATMTSQFPNAVMASSQAYYGQEGSNVCSTPPPPGEEIPHISNVANTPPVAPVTHASWQVSHMQQASGHVPHIVPPSPDLQPIVEEMARKAALVGDKAEMAYAVMDDPNYAFLRPWHELHPYYKLRKMSWSRSYYPPPPPGSTGQQSVEVQPNAQPQIVETYQEDPHKDADSDQEQDANKQSAPISFSIKPRKENTNKPLVGVSKTTRILAETPSDEEADKESRDPKPAKAVPVPTRRRFTESPEVPLQISTPQLSLPEEKSVESQPEDQSLPTVTATPIQNLPDNQKTTDSSAVQPPQDVASSNPPSNFSAVTPSGEVASVSLLREKQAARRLKALQFLKSKQKKEEENAKKENKILSPVKPSYDAGKEDIFDLSPSKSNGESKDRSIVINDTIPTPVSDPSSRSSTPQKSSSARKSKKRSRSRSRDRSRPKDPKRHRRSPDSRSRVSRSGEKSRNSSSPVSLPTAYRSSEEPRRSFTRTVAPKHRARDRRTTSPPESGKLRHADNNNSDSSPERRRKRKKEKQRRKRKKKTSSSSSSDEREDGQVSSDEHSGDVTRYDMFPGSDEAAVHNDSAQTNRSVPVSRRGKSPLPAAQQTEPVTSDRSEGEIISE